MPKVLFIDRVHNDCQEILTKMGFECFLTHNKSKKKILEEIHLFEVIIIRSKFKITKEIINKAKKLKCIARAGAGMENIDVAYAESKGIKCIHAAEGNKDAVAEHAIAMLLSLFNNLGPSDIQVRQGIWAREQNRGIELKGKTVGIVGYGNMGSAFAERLKGFGVTVLSYDKYKKNYANGLVKECKMKDLFNECDVVSIHVPFNNETKYLINNTWINKFKKNIFIINTARGKCLNTKHLVSNIISGKIKGACLDVLEYESISFENVESKKIPSALQYLIKSNKVIFSPHIAGWTQESNVKIAEIIAKKIEAHLK